MEPVIARKTWRTLEPYHAAIYFVREAHEAYAELGATHPMMGYFASRAAPMGRCPAELVTSTFFNFHPTFVSKYIPSAWDIATPSQFARARMGAADAMLRRLLGDSIGSAETKEAAELARRAAEACRPEGRPLFAGHASLDWPTEPHLVLWHSITLLREHRGDGHLAAMLIDGIDGCESLVTHAATGGIATDVLRKSRRWSQEEWDDAVDRLRSRGLLSDEGAFTDAGREMRERIEQRTDELAAPPWSAIGEEGCSRLRTLVRPFSNTITQSGEINFGVAAALK